MTPLETPETQAFDADCIFCKIISGELPSRRIYEDERAVAFLDIGAMASRPHLGGTETTRARPAHRARYFARDRSGHRRRGTAADAAPRCRRDQPVVVSRARRPVRRSSTCTCTSFRATPTSRVSACWSTVVLRRMVNSIRCIARSRRAREPADQFGTGNIPIDQPAAVLERRWSSCRRSWSRC